MGKMALKEKTRKKIKIEKPQQYKVIMLNDNYTTMDFVVFVLMMVFNKSQEEAERIMLAIHKTGSSVCGVYPLDIAESKVDRVHTLARQNNFPLKCVIEPE